MIGNNMEEEIKTVLFEMAASHAILASQEYKRNIRYNDSHFSAKAEKTFIDFMTKNNILDEFFNYCKEYNKKNETK